MNKTKYIHRCIIVCMILVLSASMFAATINLLVEPVTSPIAPNEQVLLNVYVEPNEVSIFAATAVFRLQGGFSFVDDFNLTNSGTIFIPLDINQIISGVWTMDGTTVDGNAVTISTERRLLGQIKVLAPDSGDLQLQVASISEFWESRTQRHTLGTLTVARCGDGTVGSGEECDDGNINARDGCSETCQIETGFECPTPSQACRTICGNDMVNAGETCSSCPVDVQCAVGTSCQEGVCTPVDTDGDGIPDILEGTYLVDGVVRSCVNPSFRRVFESVEFFTVSAPASVYDNNFAFLGCLKGDINNNGVFDGSDISPFVAEFRSKEGAPDIVSRADINQDGKVDGSDISPFVAEFRRNNP